MSPAVLLVPLLLGSAPPPTPTQRGEALRRPFGPVGVTGILLGAAGLGLAGAGVTRLAQGRTHAASSTDQERIITTDFRPQGRAWLGAGLSIAALGSVALAVDLAMHRKRRARRSVLIPVLGPTTAGLVVQGRFEVLAWH